MPVLIALVGALAAGMFWMYRIRNAAEMADELADMAQTAMGAARRFGFRRRANRHPVDCIDDPVLAAGTLAVAFFQLDAMPTAERRNAVMLALQNRLNILLPEAEEFLALGLWFIQQCNGAHAAVPRLAKRLKAIGGDDSLEKITDIIQDVADENGKDLSDRQIDALGDIQRIFRIA